MVLSLLRFYWLKLAGAVLALILALTYLAGIEIPALAGFALIALVAIYLTVRINRGDMPAICDLCDSPAVMSVEYGAGYADARLIINCNNCGRVINGSSGSVKPQKESK